MGNTKKQERKEKRRKINKAYQVYSFICLVVCCVTMLMSVTIFNHTDTYLTDETKDFHEKMAEEQTTNDKVVIKENNRNIPTDTKKVKTMKKKVSNNVPSMKLLTEEKTYRNDAATEEATTVTEKESSVNKKKHTDIAPNTIIAEPETVRNRKGYTVIETSAKRNDETVGEETTKNEVNTPAEENIEETSTNSYE